MTRFDATEPNDRRKLYVDAITAHRERGSAFLTLEVDDSELGGDELGTEETDHVDGDRKRNSRETTGPDPELGTPWIQFSDGTINLDCTDDELEELKAVLGEFPAFKISELTRPDDAPGTNAHVSAKADPNRIGQFLDAVFRRVYGLPAEFRVWVVAL
ncbi:hypothetical protein EA462_05175 [Natrarchaeobius halalkaliphilus]|uniref:DUF7975 domain-containing protein n=1 Tax=Natrarchaeobius halalkaliphilus TaxID=1679091 RepID=A0A3N6P1I6_9EURY|nr:hypothetical protein [Natrarchaeobius halalkaliphilus]RQG91369.1 hypothetical protein EA462_05175 [Natrarchaeobius halalkaliphilus]